MKISRKNEERLGSQVFVLELTGEQLARLVALSFSKEGGEQFPHGYERLVYQIQDALQEQPHLKDQLNTYLSENYKFASKGPVL